MAWFSLNIGRQAKADPKWLVPLICRAGEVTKRDIGAIRIFDRETKFEIRADMAAAFTNAVAANKVDDVRIHAAVAPAAAAPRGAEQRRPYAARPAGPKSGAAKPKRARAG
jgi:ATP-dependent RNA helicase DeaD